eukprot:CAMPEP_0203859284 /NCGR_PEP_ID=MMETSP0359-20131031/11753_1 /ASSEMBLY_ACC=CAM_ASM_000338 /TAXON_ID=268821 /ORGANISM="Scrippsiella Hangoei, Strain SHTV-5" /LENGTH=89 /DNA_ID=CAMNT_0050776163 /DNA_START=81 /DNA_END=350 /DNA_ORIENTATION=+
MAPGQAAQQVQQLALSQSTCSILTRILARSRGLPVPFAQGAAVENKQVATGYTLFHDYHTTQLGNPIWTCVVPTAISFGAVVWFARKLR